MADLNSKNLEEIAEEPRRAVVDGNSAEQFSLPELIEVSRYKASREAMDSNNRGFAIQKFKANGAQ